MVKMLFLLDCFGSNVTCSFMIETTVRMWNMIGVYRLNNDDVNDRKGNKDWTLLTSCCPLSWIILSRVENLSHNSSADSPESSLHSPPLSSSLVPSFWDFLCSAWSPVLWGQAPPASRSPLKLAFLVTFSADRGRTSTLSSRWRWVPLFLLHLSSYWIYKGVSLKSSTQHCVWRVVGNSAWRSSVWRVQKMVEQSNQQFEGPSWTLIGTGEMISSWFPGLDLETKPWSSPALYWWSFIVFLISWWLTQDEGFILSWWMYHKCIFEGELRRTLTPALCALVY